MIPPLPTPAPGIRVNDRVLSAEQALGLAIQLARAGQPAPAAQVLAAVRATGQPLADLDYAEAVLAHAQGAREAAIAHAAARLARDPAHAPTHALLGRLYLAGGAADLALAHLARVRSLAIAATPEPGLALLTADAAIACGLPERAAAALDALVPSHAAGAGDGRAGTSAAVDAADAAAAAADADTADAADAAANAAANAAAPRVAPTAPSPSGTLADALRQRRERIAVLRASEARCAGALAAAAAARAAGDFAGMAAGLAAARGGLGEQPALLALETYALLQCGRAEEAAAVLARALALAPSAPAVLRQQARMALRQGQGDAALAAAVRALAIAPDEADGHLALSAVHLAAGRLEAAAEAAAAALRLAPEDWAARVQVATVAARRDDFATAARHFERAVALRPGFFEAMTNLGNALRRLGDYSAAADWYRRALALQPAAVEIRVALGNAEKDFGHHAAAIASYEAALALAPAHPVAWSNLLFCSHYGNTLTPAARHARHLDYGRCFGGKAPAAPAAARARTGPLRVGFVSADLYDHPVGFFVESMLPALAKQPDLALFAYANQERRTALTERLLPAFAVWRWVRPHDDARLAAQIRADGIDVLIDLSGHTADNRLPVFALRPAPVQATWLGYFATTGLAEMDYIIADPWVLPPEDEHWFVERPARLPNSYLCLAPPAVAVAPGPLPALAGTPFTFGSFNNLAKLGDEAVQTWCRVLDAVPGSRLLLKTHQLGDAAMRERVRERFVAAGLDPARLLLEGPAPREELLAAYHRVDIALDTFPYPGGTTSVEALWMGVPVLSLHGPDFLGRVGESILRTVGLPEWVSEDADDYVARAARFAADLPALAALRGGLRERLLASPVCDAPRFARDFAALLFAMSGRAVAETR